MGYVRRLTILLVVLVVLAVPASALAGHGLKLDHPAPSFGAPVPPSPAFQSGGPGAKWELIETIATGNPHTDLDFFTQGGDTYASVGTLGVGPNGGGQSIVRLTVNGTVDPSFLTAHPSASCLSNPAAATGLQHDVEATPKGGALLNTTNPQAVRTDTQLLLDATDAEGRCHDQGLLGLENAPQGGLEIIDVTDVANPVEIGLISHIGESHTVNVDPRRPHIIYSVTSDSVAVTNGQRQNEVAGSSDRLDLDGFEMIDISSCMNFPPGTTVDAKRAACRPVVFRYRYPTTDMSLGHTLKTGPSAVFGCHELEVYPDDRLTCGSGNTLIALNMAGAFNDGGTPTVFTDDRLNGTPLSCQVRPSSTLIGFESGAMVTDCVDGTGEGAQDLSIPSWLASGAPSVTGITWLGSVYHQGRGAGGAATPAFDSTEDIDFNHESEFTQSGEYLIATDERGGGVLPPGASCSPGADNTIGNGGVHFYDVDGLSKTPPATPEQAFAAYARRPGPAKEKAIFRAQVRTKPQGTVCTAHVLQQIPGQNRIFMGWYSQGTQVIDFVENNDGTITLAEAGYFIPANANEWVSSIFRSQRNSDGSFTYFGATGDFNLGEAGRNAIDVYKVTLPPPPLSGPSGVGGGSGGQNGAGGGGRCAQRLTGRQKADNLLGSIGGDRIFGRRGADKIKGRQGDDCISSNGGRDQIKGNLGNDILKGGLGKDRAFGGRGNDTLNDRSKGRDRLYGAAGSDRLVAKGGGRDIVNCGPGRDRAVVDRRDRVKGCERVNRPKR